MQDKLQSTQSYKNANIYLLLIDFFLNSLSHGASFSHEAFVLLLLSYETLSCIFCTNGIEQVHFCNR